MRRRIHMRDVRASEQCGNPDCRRVFHVLAWQLGAMRCPFCNWPPANSGQTLTQEADERAQLAQEYYDAEERQRHG